MIAVMLKKSLFFGLNGNSMGFENVGLNNDIRETMDQNNRHVSGFNIDEAVILQNVEVEHDVRVLNKHGKKRKISLGGFYQEGIRVTKCVNVSDYVNEKWCKKSRRRIIKVAKQLARKKFEDNNSEVQVV